jgi:hypothetical protein
MTYSRNRACRGNFTLAGGVSFAADVQSVIRRQRSAADDRPAARARFPSRMTEPSRGRSTKGNQGTAAHIHMAAAGRMGR